MKIERTNIRLYADDKKVLLRYLNLGDNGERIVPVINHVISLSADKVKQELEKIYELFNHRHFNFSYKLMEHFNSISQYAPSGLSEDTKLLCGSYFTNEYTTQASALFNPSIVFHPNQSELQYDGIRFLLSLRATGEGHISSLAFMEGEIGYNGEIFFYPESNLITDGQKEAADNFYKVSFDAELPLDSHVLFPFSPEESMGIEDVRLVYIEEEKKYLGTYTAYNGSQILPKYFITKDFYSFEVRPFGGKASTNKGMALFPEKINGKYAMIGRQDGRNLSIMFSENLNNWEVAQSLHCPQYSWEMLQIGNNGSPIKTDKGWLLLTHGVGPMRRYVLSMILLDLKDPTKVIGSLNELLMEPNDEEREGYVPNVLYTCGMLLYNEIIYLPYAMSDSAISFAKFSVHDVLSKLI